MGRFIAVPANENHGWYVEDTWTGATVCDMYHMLDGRVCRFENDEIYAKNIARHLDQTIEQ